MDVLERIIFLSIGGGIGFILGFIVARLQVIETKVDNVQKEVHDVDIIVRNDRDEEGSFRPSLIHVMLALVVAVTAYSAFAASKTNQELDKTVECLTQFNTNQGLALGTRDEAITDAAEAEIDLWGLYDRLYKQAKSNPSKIPVLQDQLNEAILDYRGLLIQTQKVRETYEYDNPNVLADCEEEES